MACSGRGYVTIVGRKRLWSDHLGRGYVTIHEQSVRDKGRYRAARAAKKTINTGLLPLANTI